MVSLSRGLCLNNSILHEILLFLMDNRISVSRVRHSDNKKVVSFKYTRVKYS